MTQAAQAGAGVGGERGSGSVLTLGLVLVAMSLLLVVVSAVAVAAAAARAQTGADLGALSAAVALQHGAASPCAVAERSALAAGAELHECRVAGADVVVVATSPIPGGALGWLLETIGTEVHAGARAGPAE